MTAEKRRPAVPRKRGGSRWVFPAVLAVVVVAGVVAVAAAALGGGDDGDGGGGGSGGGGGNAVEVASKVSVTGTALTEYRDDGRDAAVGKAAPTIASVDFQGDAVEAGGATGKPYAVIFLAHWCPHCRAEVPRLVSLAENGQINGVSVTGVATGTSPAQANYPPSAWLADEDWPFGVMVDDRASTAALAYGLSSYPFMVFVDAEGNVAGRVSGEVGEADLDRIFRALAKGATLPLPGAGASSSN